MTAVGISLCLQRAHLSRSAPTAGLDQRIEHGGVERLHHVGPRQLKLDHTAFVTLPFDAGLRIHAHVVMMAIPEYRRQLHCAASPIGRIEIMAIRIVRLSPPRTPGEGLPCDVAQDWPRTRPSPPSCERAVARSSTNWRIEYIPLHTMPVGADR